MSKDESESHFDARLMKPAQSSGDAVWGFIILPADASGKLPRCGRTTIEGTINGHNFTALLEPDGRKSHWLKLDKKLLKASGAEFGELIHFEINPVDEEPEPFVPQDLDQALKSVPEALANWSDTTTLARVDWIHWVTSAKQAKTRAKRVHDACEMLASGKKRVCCFDPSGFYSKAFGAPQAAE